MIGQESVLSKNTGVDFEFGQKWGTLILQITKLD
jgi:hypothetical protein